MNIQQDTLFPKFINVHDNNSSNIESVQNHFDSETMRNKVALQEGTIPSPESIPSEPTFPRAFVEFGNSINEKDIFVTFRWKQPEFTIRTIKKYRVQYWFIENLKRIQTNVDIIPTKILQHEVYDLKPDTMYYFKVQAYNEVGAGPYTKFINVSTTHENPIPRLFSNTFYGTDVLDMDLQDVFEFKDNNDDGYLETVYSVLEHKVYGITFDTENAFKHVQKVHIKLYYDQTWGSKIRAFGKSLQPYPPTICLIPNLKDYHVKEKTITANSIIVSLPEPIPNDGCKKYNLATTIYTISVSYLTCLDNDLNKIKEFNVQTYERHYEIQNLMPFTEYTLKLALSNFYVDMLSMGLQFGANVKLKTTLNAPENVTVQVLTPTLATVYWMPLTKLNCVAVNYEVHWVPVLFPNSTQKITYQMPRDKQLIKSDRTTYGKLSMTIQPLLPGQEYFIYVRAYPANFSDIFNDSLSKSIHMYSEPNNLNLSGVSTNSMNISWIPSVNLTIQYTLEYKNDAMQKWQEVNNTKENNDEVTYYIENLLPRTLYKFRLILRYPKWKISYDRLMEKNLFLKRLYVLEYDEEISIGLLYNKDDVPSAPEISTVTESIEIFAMQYYLPLILSFVVIVVIYVCYFYYSYRRRKENNEQVLSPIIELAALYEMPYGKVQLNALYAPKSQYNTDEFALTIIKEKQITLAKLLGSGAFGKVFQGTLKNLEGLDTTPVAIKMLRKNASSREKKKFLQEAKLMSHFRHKNVLRLLGICLDAHSPLLILELMEAGDLLKYLRESRTLQPSDLYALRLQDLLAMCDDVARGCCYLEKQHFVHRDLACRNCLISAKNRENRIVKIGDFGLARDIYKDDYYRMKGEGLLPVRWMAPESLMDGIFTSKSDVWAFGVLMWEISSLGQQPYCAKTNSELMQQCWSAVDDRPNFILCLENIETLKDNIGDAILSSVDIIRHAEVNRSYFF
ncbi:proto-oncogene tyrosine-protein kinase ros [Lasius niger]|uniref:Tyrosine-protein kinase receptor n=1 Tax=Lasius niger TaxID=67767 RepID=A0A0J7N5G3_LASNI|nr:proto-oncogene tyrosine-protein kinase ros [Lasius niger]